MKFVRIGLQGVCVLFCALFPLKSIYAQVIVDGHLLVGADSLVSLEGIEIVGRHPMVRAEEGMLVYDVQRLSEGKPVTNAFEAIGQLPGIRAEGDVLELPGATSGTTLILNGKPNAMGQEQIVALLKSTPVERLGRVETSYNAPPQWHTTGAAINIELRQDPDQLNGQARVGYTRVREDIYNVGGNLYASGKRLSGDVMVSYFDSGHTDKTVEHYDHFVNGTLHPVDLSSMTDSRYRGVSLYGSLGYKLKKNNALRLSYYSNMTPYGESLYETTSNIFDGTTSEQSNKNSFHGTTFAYESRHVNAGVSYTFSDSQDKSRLFSMADASMETQSDGTVDRINLYADANHPLPHGWRLGYGASGSWVNTRSGQTLTNSKSSLEEYTANVYASVGKSFRDVVSLSLTLRGDYYGMRDYETFNLLPDLSASWMITNSHTLQLSLYSRRRYPAYWQQQDYTMLINPYQVRISNPALRPSTTYNTSLTYVLKSRYTFSVGYTHYDKQDFQIHYMDPTQLLLIYQSKNSRFLSQAQVSVSIPVTATKWWRMQFNLQGTRQQWDVDDWHGLAFNISKYAGYVSMQHYFTLSTKPQIELSVYGSYASPMLAVFAEQSDRWNVHASAKWIFAKQRAELSVYYFDNNVGGHSVITSTFEGQQFVHESSFYNRGFGASFTWKFGNYTGTRVRNDAMGTDRAGGGQ